MYYSIKIKTASSIFPSWEVVAMPMVHKQLWSLWAWFHCFHTKHCMGVFIGFVELGIIVKSWNLYYESLLCILFWGHIPPMATTNGILWQRWGLGHLQTLMSCPHSIPLNSFSVSTMARSSIAMTLYSVVFWKLLCWRTLLAYYPEWSRLPTVLRMPQCRSQKGFEKSG